VTGVRTAAEQAGAEVRDMKKDPAVVALCEKYQRGTQYPENTCKNDRHECFKSYKPEDISLRRSNSPQQSDLTTLSIHTKEKTVPTRTTDNPHITVVAIRKTLCNVDNLCLTS
jgi:hypothetical protein